VYSPAEWFYIFGGAWEMILCGVLLIMKMPPLAISAAWIGILEGFQVTACGAIMGHRRPPEGVPECDYLSGLPIGATMTALYLGIVCWAIGKNWRSASRL